MARGRGRKTDYEWLTWTFTSLALSAGTAAATLSTAIGSQTIYRLRGSVLVWLDGTPVAGDAVRVGLGVHVATEDIGTSVLASPLTDTGTPWLWSWFGALAAEVDQNEFGGLAVARVDIDSKAMRRIKSAQAVQFVVEVATVGTAQAINVVAQGRCLFGI